jgi:hypothetical protein
VLTRDVVHLDVVRQTTSDDPPPGRPVPVVLPVFEVGDVLVLLLQRQLVEPLSQSELPVYGFLRDPVVDDIEETLGPDRLDQDLGVENLERSMVGTARVSGRGNLEASAEAGVYKDSRSAQSRSSFVSGTWAY